jgi:hypothetical protein
VPDNYGGLSYLGCYLTHFANGVCSQAEGDMAMTELVRKNDAAPTN